MDITDKPQPQSEVEAEPRTPRLLRIRRYIEVAALVAAICIVIGIASLIGSLHGRASTLGKADAGARHITALAPRLLSLEAQRNLGQGITPQLEGAIRTSRTSFDAAVDLLNDLDSGPTTQQLQAAAHEYSQTIDRFDQLAQAGDRGKTLDWYTGQVDPQYTTLLDAAARASAYYAGEASNSNVAAGVGALGTTVLAGILMAVLIWVFERARQSTYRRLTEQRERALLQSEQKFRSLVQNTADVIMVANADGTIRYVSPSVERILGYQPGGLLSRNLKEYVHPEDHGRAERLLIDTQRKVDATATAEYRIQHARGYWLYVETLANNLLETPGVNGIMLTSRDISERWMLEEQLVHQAFHDSLTGLPNRVLFMDRLAHALSRTGRHDEPRSVAVLFLDLDNFKVINDTLGHKAGDQLLSSVAERIQHCTRDGDTVARLGGDEFTILLEDIAGTADATAMAERLAERLQEPFTLNDQKVFVTASTGIAVSTSSRDRPEELLRNADIAMYDVKNHQKSHYAVFDTDMNLLAWKRLRIETELRTALEQSQFRVYYQPIVDIGTGAALGLEALVRWQHPDHGLILPGDFIPVAEDAGLIVPIGRWVLSQACKQVKAWREAGECEPDLVLSVNLSPRQFRHPQLVPDIIMALRESKFEPYNLKLEITESIALDHSEATLAKFEALRKMGIRLAIDDFGTGYSALGYLKRYPVDTLKVDRSFVQGLGTNHEDNAIVRAVLAFARTLKLHVTAEGVETAEQLAHLQTLGCDSGQGYYFSRPLPGDDVAAFLKRTVLDEEEVVSGGQ